MSLGLYDMIGEHSAANYLDECVFRKTQEPDILFRILIQMSADDEATRAELRGFARYLHSMLEVRYGY